MFSVSAEKSPIIIGHRGASGYRPEHSEAAYRLAFQQGAEYVEPDIVATRDGQLVVRHENEISGTTDVAEHPEFFDRRTTKIVDGVPLTGWFTEDFTWSELATLRCIERLPHLRPLSAAYDGRYGILRLRDLCALIDSLAGAADRPLGMVAEIKHASYFSRLNADLELDELFAAEISAAGWNDQRLIVESFEPTVLAKIRQRNIRARSVLLVDDSGIPADLLAEQGSTAPAYSTFLTPEGLAECAKKYDGVSISKSVLFHRGAPLVSDAHSHGLTVYTWTFRPENIFLDPRFRRAADPAAFGDWSAECAALFATGIDGVFADHPDLAVAARAALGEK